MANGIIKTQPTTDNMNPRTFTNLDEEVRAFFERPTIANRSCSILKSKLKSDEQEELNEIFERWKAINFAITIKA